jgi:hypothetical protein
MKALHRYLPARSFALQVKRHRSNAWLPIHVSSWAAERTNFPREVAEAALWRTWLVIVPRLLTGEVTCSRNAVV